MIATEEESWESQRREKEQKDDEERQIQQDDTGEHRNFNEYREKQKAAGVV
jgi:hypothetical protein